MYLLTWRVIEVCWTLCQDFDWTLKIDVIWTSCFEYGPTMEGRHFTGSGKKTAWLRKFEKKKYLSTVAPFVRAQKLRGVALKRRHGNIIFTKMNLLQNRIFFNYIWLVIMMITRGRLAIGNAVTSLERPMDIHIYVHVTYVHMNVCLTFNERSDWRPAERNLIYVLNLRRTLGERQTGLLSNVIWTCMWSLGCGFNRYSIRKNRNKYTMRDVMLIAEPEVKYQFNIKSVLLLVV